MPGKLNPTDHMRLVVDERNSMVYWYPKIAKHPNVPKTKLFPVKPESVVSWIEEGLPKEIYQGFRKTIEEFIPELPLLSRNFVFIRGSRASDKFHFESVCKLDLTKFEKLSEKEKDSEIAKRVFDIAEFHVMNGLPLEALAVREFIRISSWFFCIRWAPDRVGSKGYSQGWKSNRVVALLAVGCCQGLG